MKKQFYLTEAKIPCHLPGGFKIRGVCALEPRSESPSLHTGGRGEGNKKVYSRFCCLVVFLKVAEPVAREV